MEEKVLIKMSELSDLDAIMDFLKSEWNLSKEYYEQFHIINGKLLFLVGYGEQSNEIYGVCGLIPTHMHKNVKQNYQLVLLRVKKCKNFSAISLLDYLNNLGINSISSCGIKPKVVILYEWLGFETGKMNHFYKLNEKVSEYNIAVVKDIKVNKSQTGNKKLEKVLDISELKDFDFEKYADNTPYKDFWCIKHRYFDEKYHKYDVYKIIDDNGKYDSLIVMRPVYFDNGAICKIVDFIGNDNDISDIGMSLDEMLYKNQYEYIDFYSVGISEEIMNNAGFVLLDESDNNIIPHYTEPVLQINKDIFYATNNSKNFHTYVGDCDQDRSNYGYSMNVVLD